MLHFKDNRKLLKGDDMFEVLFGVEQKNRNLLGTRYVAGYSTARSVSLFLFCILEN